MSTPMKKLVKLGHAPHSIDRKKYGQARLAVYWAGRRFKKPGVIVWALGRHWRIVPVPKRRATHTEESG